jgi:coenzyme PQQ precursor peptide PqqA
MVMEWEMPEFNEISLACEINGYANAELSASTSREQGEK